ncbi:integrase family protein [Rhizobium phaseoli]|uniref:hypothetical protein n=1 Tax=Rhizobium phaseoli TaxID=396 RepID=UPI0007E970A1|nr:hypothetical protein [Rhizobium phaseoli]ANL64788.1 integrase family protein [Rhizobium phaseoli]ANL77602.1 integrase family protein [Rhizobium phaseoli]
MGRPSAGARWWHDKKNDKFFIRDVVDGKSVKFSLGFGVADEPDFKRRREAEVAKYVAQKHAGERQRIKHQDASDVFVAEVIASYIKVRIHEWEFYEYDNPPARVDELEARLRILLDFFGQMTVTQIDHETVRDFVDFLDERTYQRKLAMAQKSYEKVKKRRDWKPETDTGPRHVEKGFNPKAAIRYLDDLNSAIEVAVKRTKLLKYGTVVPTPKDYKPRTAVFTRKQVADLIKAARRKRGHAFIGKKPVKNASIWMHLARFLLIAIYTGSRKDKVWRTSFRNERDCPWVEFKGSGSSKIAIYHRIGDKEVEHAKKLAPTIPVPTRLAAHLERWKRMGLKHPCQGLEGSVGNPRTAMENLFAEVLGDDHDAVIHTLRHTAATWLVSRAELPMAAIASYLGMSVETLVRRYAKVRMIDHIRVGRSFTQSRAGSEHHSDPDSTEFHSGRFVPPVMSSDLTDTDRNKSVSNGSKRAENQNNAMNTVNGGDDAAA